MAMEIHQGLLLDSILPASGRIPQATLRVHLIILSGMNLIGIWGWEDYLVVEFA